MGEWKCLDAGSRSFCSWRFLWSDVLDLSNFFMQVSHFIGRLLVIITPLREFYFLIKMLN